MESQGELYCEVCKTSYESSDTSPRCLTCSHVFCGVCISSLMTPRIKCPKCHSTIVVLTAEDIDNLNSTNRKSSFISSSSSTGLQESQTATSLANEQNTGEEQGISCSLGEKIIASNSNVAKLVNDCQSRDVSIDERDERNASITLIENQTPVVLVQACESLQSSTSSHKNEVSDNLCCDTSDAHLNNHLFPPSNIQYLAEEQHSLTDHESLKSSNSSDKISLKFRIIPDSPDDCRYEHTMRLPMDRNIPSHLLDKNLSSEQMQNYLAVGNELREDSLIVHRSNSCDIDSLPVDLVSNVIQSEDDVYKHTKENELHKFNDQIQILHEVLETVDDAILTLRVEQEQHESKKQSLLQLIKDEEDSIESSRLKIQEALEKKRSVQQVTEILREKEEAIANTESLDTLKSTLEKACGPMTVAEDLGTETELYYMQLLLSKNVRKPEYLERMIDLGVKVVGEYQVDGEWRWSRVSLSDSLIHVHALQTDLPPTECRILPWNCLKAMIPPENALTFLDISLNGKSQGRVYLSMFGDTPRGQQFVTLSTGEHKYCYKKIKMKQWGNQDQPGEYVSFHGPKNSKGSPVRGVVSGISQGGVYTRRKTSGLLAGAALSHRQRTLFVVYLQSDLDEDTTGAFGEVTKGLEILKDISKHEQVHEVEIEDCGFVIPLINTTN